MAFGQVGFPIHGKQSQFIIWASIQVVAGFPVLVGPSVALNLESIDDKAAADTVPAYGFQNFVAAGVNYQGTNGQLFKQDVAGAQQMTLTFKGFWDATPGFIPYLSPVFLTEGSFIACQFIIYRGGVAPAPVGPNGIIMPGCLVKDVNTVGDVNKRVDVSGTLMSQGQYFYV